MNPFIYTLFYIILLSISYRVRLSISLAISGLVSIFILISYIRHISYEGVLFILFFNSIPLITDRFKRDFNNYKALKRLELESVRGSYDELMEREKLHTESKLEIERKIQQVSSLYEISKDMSICLTLEDIFHIFSSVLKKSFRFKLARLVLLRDYSESEAGIDSVYQIELGRQSAKSAPDSFDKELIEIVLETNKELMISSSEISPFSRRLSVIKGFESLIAMPFIAEGKIAGILYVENMPGAYFDNFVILAGQFAIQLHKVILYKKVQDMAITDSLTEVSTRRHFLERFREEIRRSMRKKVSMSFLMVDLDYFKEKNDKFGHLVGDVILKEAAKALKSNLREIDIIARYGGEEFSVVLSGIGKTEAMQVAERLRLSVEKSVFKAYDEEVSITVSIGVASFPEDGVDMDSLIEAGDRALYKAKEKGRNQVA